MRFLECDVLLFGTDAQTMEGISSEMYEPKRPRVVVEMPVDDASKEVSVEAA